MRGRDSRDPTISGDALHVHQLAGRPDFHQGKVGERRKRSGRL